MHPYERERSLRVSQPEPEQRSLVTVYPVHYSVEHPPVSSRLQLVARVVAVLAVGVVGVTFGGLFLFAYLALPVVAASRLASGGASAYAENDGPRILGVLHWIAAVLAWLGLIAENLPRRSPGETVELVVEGSPHPTARSAMWRVLFGVPSALVLAILGFIGLFVWVWAAVSILAVQRVGDRTFHYLLGLQRWSIRLLCYQACLVDEYPPFSFADVPPAAMPGARVAS